MAQSSSGIMGWLKSLLGGKPVVAPTPPPRFAAVPLFETPAPLMTPVIEPVIEPVPEVMADVLGDLIATVSAGAAYVFVPAAELEAKPRPVTAVPVSIEADHLVLQLTDGPEKAASGGKTGGYSIRVPDELEAAASEHSITVHAVARALGAGAARFAVTYSTADVGNSGWRWFDASGEWAEFTMQYTVPQLKNGNGDYLGLLPDVAGSPGVEIAAVAVRVL